MRKDFIYQNYGLDEKGATLIIIDFITLTYFVSIVYRLFN